MTDILGKYKFIRKLGRGTYGEVALVEKQNGEQIALKMIPKKNLQQTTLVNLEGEIACMTQMKSRYIMRMYGVEEDENYKYLECEYCNEGDLLNYQAKQPSRVFSLNEAAEILTDVIYGLEQLHSSGYLHRDIKSQNIIIKKDQKGIKEFKLADFGFAKKQNLIGGTVLGSEYFMAPEIYTEQPYGFEVDMWAFGVLFYFMLNMEYPFKVNPHVMVEKRTEILRKLADNFNYEEYIKNSKKKMVQNCVEDVNNLFKRIFTANPDKRITFAQIRMHPVFSKYFPDGVGKSKNIYDAKVKRFSSKMGKKTFIFNSGNVQKKKGTPERLYLEAQHDKLTFLIDSQKQLNSCEPLSIALRQSLNYNLIKYFIILYKDFLKRLKQEQLKKQAPELNWDDYCKKIQFKKLVNRYKQDLSEAEIKFSTYYDSCSYCLEDIGIVNKKFNPAFNQQIVQTELCSSFKDSYRGSTGAAYEKLVRYLKQHPENNQFYVIVIIAMCHAFNHLLQTTREELHEVFIEYVNDSGEKIGKYIDFEHLRGWLSDAPPKKQKSIINKLIKKFF